MKIEFSSKFEKSFQKIKHSQPKQVTIISKQIELFSEDQTHPSLRLHRLSGKMKNYFSLSTGRNLRIIFTKISTDTYLFYDIGTHDQVYRSD